MKIDQFLQPRLASLYHFSNYVTKSVDYTNET